MAADRLEVTAFSHRGPAPGRLPQLRWSVWDEPSARGLFHLYQDTVWQGGAGTWDVPVSAAGRVVLTPQLVGWQGRWDRRRGLWLQRWTLATRDPGQVGDPGESGGPDEVQAPDLPAAGMGAALAVGGQDQVVDVDVDQVRCRGEALAHRVLVEIVVDGGLYLSGGAAAGRALREGRPLLHRPYRIEDTAVLDVPEARGEGEEWIAAASVRDVQVRPAAVLSAAAPGSEQVEVTVLVRLQWRLLREEAVELPRLGQGAGEQGGRFLIKRVLAEGTAHIPVRRTVSLGRARTGLASPGAGSAFAGGAPGGVATRGGLSGAATVPRVVHLALPSLAVRSLESVLGLRVFLDPAKEGTPRWAVLERGRSWRLSGTAVPGATTGRPAALMAAEWQQGHGSPTRLVCTVTVSVEPA